MNNKNQTNPKYGKLYGLGVGTGDPELMTVKAIKTLNSVDVIVIPQSSPHVDSVAWRIAKSHVQNKETMLLKLHFPMTKEVAVIREAWSIALQKIGEQLILGKSVAFITEGDPLFYSTYIYLHKNAPVLWEGIEIEIVPAVCSMTAVCAVSQIPIADGKEKVAIVPASYGLDSLAQIFKLFDTILLMKVSSVMPQVVELLEKEGLLDKAVYVSKATMQYQQIIVDLKSIQNDKCDYFSMVVVKKLGNDGVLFKETSIKAENN